MLAVIQQEQQAPGRQPVGQRLRGGATSAFMHAQRRCDRRRDKLRVGDGRQVGPPRAVGELGLRLGRGAQRQTGLAHAPGPGQRDQAVGRQQLAHLCQVVLPADQAGQLRRQVAGPDSRDGGRGPDGRNGGRQVERGAIGRPRLGLGRRAQLLTQGRGAGIEGAHHAGAIAGQRVQAHQPPMGCLVQWIRAEQALGARDGGREVLRFLQALRQPLGGRQGGLVQPFADGGDPIIVAIGEQVAGIGRDGCAQRRALGRRVAGLRGGRGARQRRLEFRHVQRDRRVRLPADRVAVELQPARARGQSIAQPVQQVAQVAPGPVVARVGPEREGQLLAGDGAAGMQEQVGEEVLQARLRQGLDRPTTADQPKAAQELNIEGVGCVHQRRSLTRLIQPTCGCLFMHCDNSIVHW